MKTKLLLTTLAVILSLVTFSNVSLANHRLVGSNALDLEVMANRTAREIDRSLPFSSFYDEMMDTANAIEEAAIDLHHFADLRYDFGRMNSKLNIIERRVENLERLVRGAVRRADNGIDPPVRVDLCRLNGNIRDMKGLVVTLRREVDLLRPGNCHTTPTICPPTYNRPVYPGHGYPTGPVGPYNNGVTFRGNNGGAVTFSNGGVTISKGGIGFTFGN